jgi:DNA-binding NtrC family response regulator
MRTFGWVLVVDDDHAMRAMVSSLLRDEGFEVVAALGADDALSALEGGCVRAVLSDIRMPGKSGFDFLSAARGVAPEVPVILMTSFGSGMTVDRAMREGAFGCLSKPFSREELLGMLSRALTAPVAAAPVPPHALGLPHR